MKMNILGNLHVIQGLVPVDVGSTGTEIFTDVVDAGEATELEFIVSLGAITTDDTVIKLYSDANTVAAGGTAIAFKYKLSAALGTDTSGAWTACASTGLTLTATTDTNKTLRVNVDPKLCVDLPYVYLGIDPGESQTVGLYSVVCVAVPRYSQSVPPSMVN
jgi:hypothetical protein